MRKCKNMVSLTLVFFLVVVMSVPSGSALAADTNYSSNQLNTLTTTEPEGLGYPLAVPGSTQFINSAYGVETVDGQEVNVVYTSSSGDNTANSEAPAKFVVYDLDNRQVLRDFPLPGAKTVWSHGVDSQGNVYIGTQSYANVFRYSPVTKQLENLGAIRSSDNTLQSAIYHVSFDSEDNAYFGTYPNALIVKYDVTKKQFENVQENVFGGQYIKSHVIADDGYMYFFGSAANNTEAKFARMNLATYEIEELSAFSYTGPFQNSDGIKNLTNEKLKFNAVHGLSLRGNYIFANPEATVPSNLSMVVIYDIENKRWLTESENVMRSNGTHVPPALDNKVYVWDRGNLKLKAFDLATGTYSDVPGSKNGDVHPTNRGSTFIEFENQEELPGYTLVTVQSDGTVTYNSFGYPDDNGGFSGGQKFVWANGNTYGYESVVVDIGLQPRVIRALEVGLQGTDTIAIGAYMGPFMGILNSKTDEIKYIGMDQAEGFGEAHGKYYVGAYPKAEIFTVDFDTTDFSKSTKSIVAKLSDNGIDQDRPFEIIEAGDYVAISSVPDYGVLDGALTLLHKDDLTQKEVFKGIIENQSIIGLAYKDGKIYGSTAVWGGLGIEPVDLNAKVFIFDLETKEITKVAEPTLQNVSPSVMHIGGLTIGPKGDLWAISKGVVFELDPETLEVMRQFTIKNTSWSAATTWWVPFQMNWLSDTLLVTNAGEVLSAIDTTTGEVRQLSNRQANLMAVSEDKENIYFSSDSQYKLYKMGISFEEDGTNEPPIHVPPYVPTSTPAPTYGTTVIGNQVVTTIPVNATTDSSGRAVATVSETELASAISSALDRVEQEEIEAEAAIRIEVQTDGEMETAGIRLTTETLKKFMNSKADKLTIVTPFATITIDQITAEDITKKATGLVTITTTKHEPVESVVGVSHHIGNSQALSVDITDDRNTIIELDNAMTISIPYELGAGENVNAIVVYQLNHAGQAEMVSSFRYDPILGMIIFDTPYASKYAVVHNQIAFADVADNAWYYDAVTFAAARGITTGVGNGYFGSKEPVTRAQTLVMLMRAFGISPDNDNTNNFSDAGNTYYTGYLAAAKKLGITTGIGSNKFAPDKEISRQEMFMLTYNLLKSVQQLPVAMNEKTLEEFKDASDVASYAKEAIALFIKTGIVKGSNGNILPADTASRAEFVQILYNVLRLN